MTDLNKARTHTLNALRHLRIALADAEEYLGTQIALRYATLWVESALRLMRVDPETGQVEGDPTPACVDPAEL